MKLIDIVDEGLWFGLRGTMYSSIIRGAMEAVQDNPDMKKIVTYGAAYMVIGYAIQIHERKKMESQMKRIRNELIFKLDL